MTTFEALPNEIFVECLEYLTTWEIFHGFNQLNTRFQTLIQSIPLHLNFQKIPKEKFLQICHILRSNPNLKSSIHTLQLLNRNLYKQIDFFLSWFSFDEFSQLKRIALIDIDQNSDLRIKSLTPFKCKSFNSCQSLVDQLPTITHLTLTECFFNDLCLILNDAIQLKYLNLGSISKSNQTTNSLILKSNLQLKRIIMKNFECNFDDLEFVLSQTPNIDSLTIISKTNSQLINAPRWQYLIQNSLTKLVKFQFSFSMRSRLFILENFQQFQTTFWLDEHQWQTDYGYNGSYSIIHTIPFVSNEYVFEARPIRYQLNKTNKFQQTEKLDLTFESPNAIRWRDYFDNIKSLTLRFIYKNQNESIVDKFILDLSSIMNLSNVEHLNIFTDTNDEYIPMICFEIFKRSSRLSSINFNSIDLNCLFEHKPLCNYFNEMIVNLESQNYYSFETFSQVELFCRIFSNIEQFKYKLTNREYFVYLLNELTHLSIVDLWVDDFETFLSWFNQEKYQFNRIFHIEKNCRLWIESVFPSM